jgi:restriction endonuclease S subunit
MKKYDEYKDSGVAWIGEVPKHWEILRGKYVLKILSGFPFDSQKFEFEDNGVYMPLIRIRDINGSSTEVYYSGSYPIESVVKTGEVLIGMDGDFNISKWKGTNALLNQRVCKLREDSSMNTHYAFYMLSSPLKAINSVTYATTVKHLSVYDIYNAFIPVPPISEQAAISTYLDTHCAKIDNLISIQQKRIALLQELKQSVITHAVTKGLNPNVEMKQSGVEWIGDVPKHWEVCKLKHYSQVFGRIGFRGYNQTDLVNEGEGAITLSPSNMQNGILNYDKCSYLSWKKYYESPEIMIYNDDVLFVKTGSTYGKISYVADLPMEATINPQIVVFKNIKGNNKYLYYLLSNDIVQMQVSLTVGGSTIPTLSQESILNYIVPLAPKVEQAAIASYLDHKCATIDVSISNAQHQIDLLQEYKQSLITEVVTGKRKVTDN